MMKEYKRSKDVPITSIDNMIIRLELAAAENRHKKTPPQPFTQNELDNIDDIIAGKLKPSEPEKIIRRRIILD